jgi:hypothetical protein
MERHAAHTLALHERLRCASETTIVGTLVVPVKVNIFFYKFDGFVKS